MMIRKSLSCALLVLGWVWMSFALGQLQPRSVSGLESSLGQNRPLPLEQAFPFFVSETSPGQYRITWEPAPGHYLYRHTFAFSLQQSEGGDETPLSFQLPDGLKKTDQFFGEIEAYYDRVSADLSLEPEAEASLIIEYQGCADWGFCYPPQRSVYPLNP